MSMLRVETVSAVREQVRQWKRSGLTVGFVPTMGNLHQGHIRLVEEALRRADRVVASIFVNPTQFGPSEDFDSYPRTLEADCGRLSTAGCHLVFAPAVDEMYPDLNRTWVDVDALGDHLCGASRPGHFRGVTTVVSKLFNIVQPDLACFGEKDFQQLAIIRRMARDLFMPVEIVAVPTMREASGLAMSSRNGYLTAAQRAQAAGLYEVLQCVRQEILDGATDMRDLERRYSQALENRGFSVDYLTVAEAETLVPAASPQGRLVVAAAARLGNTRLIDNVSLIIEAVP